MGTREPDVCAKVTMLLLRAASPGGAASRRSREPFAPRRRAATDNRFRFALAAAARFSAPEPAQTPARENRKHLGTGLLLLTFELDLRRFDVSGL